MLPKCECCGRFMSCKPGAAWQMVYTGYPPTPDHERYRCVQCVQRWGAFDPQDGIKPEASCGQFAETAKS